MQVVPDCCEQDRVSGKRFQEEFWLHLTAYFLLLIIGKFTPMKFLWKTIDLKSSKIDIESHSGGELNKSLVPRFVKLTMFHPEFKLIVLYANENLGNSNSITKVNNDNFFMIKL